MKKHQACFWLNKISDEKIEELNRFNKPHDGMTRDPATGKTRPSTAEENERQENWRKDAIEKLHNELEALDIAATSLTK